MADPALTRTTPERVWLSTGLRAVDHCVETICSSNPNEGGTAHSLKGIGLLIPGLLRTKRDPGDDEARLRCQLGAAESMKATNLFGVRVGRFDDGLSFHPDSLLVPPLREWVNPHMFSYGRKISLPDRQKG